MNKESFNVIVDGLSFGRPLDALKSVSHWLVCLLTLIIGKFSVKRYSALAHDYLFIAAENNLTDIYWLILCLSIKLGSKFDDAEIRWQNVVREMFGTKTNFRSMWQFWFEKITWCDMVSGWKGLFATTRREEKKMTIDSWANPLIVNVTGIWQKPKPPTTIFELCQTLGEVGANEQKKNIWKHWTFIACNEAFKRARKGENKRLNVAIRQLNIFTSLKWNDWMPTITIRIIVKYRHHHITKSHSHKCTPYNKIK